MRARVHAGRSSRLRKTSAPFCVCRYRGSTAMRAGRALPLSVLDLESSRPWRRRCARAAGC
jgi:hypothetical protein